MDNFLFIEVEFDTGELFRVRQDLTYWKDYKKVLGEWFDPEANSPGCPCFGVIECMAQDDTYSGLFYAFDRKITRVKVYLSNE